MKQYDPAVAPSPSEWLALDEGDRLALVRRFHARAKVRLPNARLHAVMHTVIENQLAEGIPEVVQTLDRLRREGLDRHDALHAIGTVLANRIFEIMSKEDEGEEDPNPAYFAGLRGLTASAYLASETDLDDAPPGA